MSRNPQKDHVWQSTDVVAIIRKNGETVQLPGGECEEEATYKAEPASERGFQWVACFCTLAGR